MVSSTTEWLSFLRPFVTLSYPTDTPVRPDSFPNSSFYNTGPQDLCFLITCIAVMAVLRDALRLGVFEPFATWKLSRDLRHRRNQRKLQGQTNGSANGNGHSTGNQPSKKELKQMRRSVMRFAEQGWSVTYYPLQWCFGLVSSLPSCCIRFVVLI